MSHKIQLTPAQHAVLAYAIHHAEGRVDWFPKNITGGARIKVLEGLASRDLITQEDDAWFVTSLGYETMGCAHLGVCRTFATKREIGHFLIAFDGPTRIRAALERGECASFRVAALRCLKSDRLLEPILPQDAPSAEPDGTSATEEPAPAPETPDAKPLARLGSKRARLLEVLQSPAGATLGQMMLLTGWQAHSVRGQLAHLKKAGMNLTSAKENGARIYRV